MKIKQTTVSVLRVPVDHPYVAGGRTVDANWHVARAVDVVVLDLARVGGVTPWRKIAALAQAYRIPVCGHVVPEIQVQLLAAIPNGHLVEYVPRSAGILTSMPRLENGELLAPLAPGLGLELDETAVQQYWVG